MEQTLIEPTEGRSFSRLQKWSIGFHVGLSVLAAAAIVAMVNYLAHRHNERAYLSQGAAHKLSPLTLQVLSSLTNAVRVVVFFDRREPLFGAVSSLIKEYQARSPRIDLEFVDYRYPGRAEAIRSQYKMAAGTEGSRVIFDANGQVRTVLSTELSEFGAGRNNEIQRTGFKGEQLFTAAILNITEAKPVIACFLQGHGEHDPSDESDRGYSRLMRLLENNNVQVKALGPVFGTDVPPDCGLLIIAGPTQIFEEQEIARLEKYLNRGGRLLLLYNYNGVSVVTGLEKLLWNWNIEIGLNWVQDLSQAQSGQSGVILTGNYGVHPIVRSLLRTTLKLIMPRSIGQRPGASSTANAPKVAELLYTSSEGRVIRPEGNNTGVVQKTGRIPLMVAVERGGVQGVATDRGAARIVVAGDSLFLSNVAFNQAANADFAQLAVNWLVNRDSLLNEIGPSPITEYQILLSQTEMTKLHWLFLGVIPGAVMVLGFFVWLRRRA